MLSGDATSLGVPASVATAAPPTPATRATHPTRRPPSLTWVDTAAHHLQIRVLGSDLVHARIGQAYAWRVNADQGAIIEHLQRE
jgi:hypothetical protein